jgi:chaperonin GroEL (HSP60 family)
MPQKFFSRSGVDFQKSLILAFEKIQGIIQTSYGYDGAYTLFIEEGQPPIATNDGYQILRKFEPQTADEAVAHQLLLQCAERTNLMAGDGTTATIILASELASRTLSELSLGVSPSSIKKALKMELEQCLQILDKNTIKDISKLDIFNLATTSTRNPKIAAKIAEMFEKSEGGTQEILRTEKDEISVEITEGLNFPQYFLHQLLKPTNREQCFDLSNPYIYVSNLAFSNATAHLSSLFLFARENKMTDLVLIAPEFEGDTLHYILNINTSQSDLRIHPVLTPTTMSSARAEVNYDLTALLGGKTISNEQDLNNPILEDFGTCKQLILTNTKCSVFGPNKNPVAVETRLSQIDHAINNSEGSLRMDSLQILLERRKRLHLLTGVIKVGARTSTESEALYRMIEDAVRSIQSSQNKGIVPGSCWIYTEIYNATELSEMENLAKYLFINSFGADSLEAYPEEQGGDYVKTVASIKKMEKHYYAGVNYATGQIVEDLRAEGIIDNAFAVEETIKNAYSLATSCVAQNYFYKQVGDLYSI